MMTRTILINLICGLAGFIFTFLFSLRNNLPMTSLFRGLAGFILWFLLAFFLRWILGFIVKQTANSDNPSSSSGDVQETLGAQVDILTPDQNEELKDLLKPKPEREKQENGEFKPLQPPKLVSMKDPEELAKAVRHLKNE
ncbi:hypothetical protein SAMN04487895_101437 [Paenibacillus sophorae]|uniref:Chloride channel protein n=1 Tax=Paenibacillus sophorae TaxID=1333845 RepID=A0A1H8GAM7_9BACL|nr:hypothetical protein [Paenibacillus sophorae]QWU14154.1 chloride channel protein [Paenibacillus sophorae]SEN40800.1 hypothetical protein SAMN04487895_101437 [Paenibacillus sophorae]